MARKSILHAIRISRNTTESSFAANNNSQQIPKTIPEVPVIEKTKRIVVDMPQSDHIKIKIFATQHGISIKQLVLIALQDAMQDND